MAGELINQGEQVIKERPDSPTITAAEGGQKVARTFTGPWAACKAGAPLVGSFVASGDYKGLRVTAVEIKKVQGNRGELSVTYEGIGWIDGVPQNPLPRAECSIEFEETQFPMELHPAYAELTRDDVAAVKAALEATSEEDREEAYARMDQVGEIPVLMQDLYWKLAHGETHFLFFAPVLKWTRYFYAEPVASAGGYPEVPYAPITLPDGIVWLRKGDTKTWNGQQWVLQQSWLGAFWIDTDVYPVGVM
jgi:hypothetical protein